MERNSSIETGDALTILVSVFRHIQRRANAPNDDDLDLLRVHIVAFNWNCLRG